MPVPFGRLPSGAILVDVAKRAGDRRVVLYAGLAVMISAPIWVGRCRG